MTIRQFIKRVHIWRYKYISQKNFVILLSMLIGLLAGLVSVTIKNITFGIEWLLEKVVIWSQNSIYFILPVIGIWLVYLFMKYIAKKPVEHAIPSILFSLSKKNGLIKPSKIYLPLITAPLTVGFGGSVGLLGPAIASA